MGAAGSLWILGLVLEQKPVRHAVCKGSTASTSGARGLTKPGAHKAEIQEYSPGTRECGAPLLPSPRSLAVSAVGTLQGGACNSSLAKATHLKSTVSFVFGLSKTSCCQDPVTV